MLFSLYPDLWQLSETAQTEVKTEATQSQASKTQQSQSKNNKSEKTEAQVKNSAVEMVQNAEHVKTAIQKAAGYISDALSRWL